MNAMQWGVFRRRKTGQLFRRPEGIGTYTQAWRLAVATANILDYDIILAPLDQAGQLPFHRSLIVRGDGTCDSAMTRRPVRVCPSCGTDDGACGDCDDDGDETIRRLEAVDAEARAQAGAWVDE